MFSYGRTDIMYGSPWIVNQFYTYAFSGRRIFIDVALSAVRAVPVMWELASRFFDHFAFSLIQTDAPLLVRAM